MAKSNFSVKEVANENATSSTSEKTLSKKHRTILLIWMVLSKARGVFNAQLSRSNDIKLECITRFMDAKTLDADKFWADYFEQVAKLLDSRRYLMECNSLNCDPANLAEHIVFLGSAAINKVLKNGIYNTLGNDIHLYKERLSPQRADIYRDAETASLKETKLLSA